jgi:2-aminoadipate transaminase
MSKYAKRMKTMEEPANIIKGLFGAMNDPDVISFGGGAIAKECLPVDEVREITNQIMRVEGRGYEILSYGPVTGVKDLREVIVKDLLAPKGVTANPDNILITSGGLEAMTLMCIFCTYISKVCLAFFCRFFRLVYRRRNFSDNSTFINFNRNFFTCIQI